MAGSTAVKFKNIRFAGQHGVTPVYYCFANRRPVENSSGLKWKKKLQNSQGRRMLNFPTIPRAETIIVEIDICKLKIAQL